MNDERPEFRSAHYVAEIAENAQRGTPVTFLGSAVAEVFDYDQGTNGTFKLTLEGGDAEMFEVHILHAWERRLVQEIVCSAYI